MESDSIIFKYEIFVKELMDYFHKKGGTDGARGLT